MSDKPDILTAEEVAEHAAALDGPLYIPSLCNSHEALRSLLSARDREIGELKAERNAWRNVIAVIHRDGGHYHQDSTQARLAEVEAAARKAINAWKAHWRGNASVPLIHTWAKFVESMKSLEASLAGRAKEGA